MTFKYALLALSLACISCRGQAVKPKNITHAPTIVPLPSTFTPCDSISLELVKYKKNYVLLRDSLRVQNMRINMAKDYLKKVNRNPSQVKFLRGWMTRAMQ